MSWARLDDRYDDHPKVKAATRRDPLATTLHPQSITSCARHETDGLIDPWWIEERAPVKRKREAAIAVLVELRLWDVLPAGESREFTDSKGYVVVVGPFDTDRMLVHDYLDYNDSSAYHIDKRARDAARKRKPHNAESGGNPRGVPADSSGTPVAETPDSAPPDPTRPDLVGKAWGAGASEHVDGERLQAVVAVLRTAPRLTFDPMLAGVANTMAAFPGADHIQAAHVAVSNVADPNYRTVDAAKALRYAINDLERQQRPRGNASKPTAADRRSEHDRLQDERRETALRVLSEQSDEEGRAA